MFNSYAFLRVTIGRGARRSSVCCGTAFPVYAAADRRTHLALKTNFPTPADENQRATVTTTLASPFARLAIGAILICVFAVGGAFVWHQRRSPHAPQRMGEHLSASDARSAETGRDNVTGDGKSRTAPTPAYESQLQDRTITMEQRAKFVSALRQAPHDRVFVSAFRGDRESYLYAAQIASMLREARFLNDDPPVSFLPEAEAQHSPPVQLFVSDKIPIRPHALAIKNALDLIGIRCEIDYRETPGRPGDLQIAIYPKPSDTL